MKSAIYISGIACINLLMFGCMFKIFYWPGANILLLCAIFLFCFFFLPASLISHYQDQKKFMWLHMVTFIVFFTCMMATLFKVLHWPASGIFLLISVPLPYVLFLPVYFYQTRNEKKKGDMNTLSILFGLIFIAVFSVMLAFNA